MGKEYQRVSKERKTTIVPKVRWAPVVLKPREVAFFKPALRCSLHCRTSPHFGLFKCQADPLCYQPSLLLIIHTNTHLLPKSLFVEVSNRSSIERNSAQLRPFQQRLDALDRNYQYVKLFPKVLLSMYLYR